MKSFLDQVTPRSILIFTNLLLLVCLHNYLFITHQLSVDLSGHLALIEKLQQQLWHGQLVFYDRWDFTGYPAFLFYGFLVHLVTAIISIPLNTCGISTATILNLSLVVSLVMIPNSLYFLAKGLLDNLIIRQRNMQLTGLAIASSIFGFFLIYNPDSSLGLGLGAAIHIGMYPQAWAWHLMLISIGLALRLDRRQSEWSVLGLILTLSALILSHPLTAIYTFLFLIIFWIFSQEKMRLFMSLAISLLLTAIWWKNLLIFNEYVASELGTRNSVSFLNLLTHYTHIFAQKNWSYALIITLLFCSPVILLQKLTSKTFFFSCCLLSTIILTQTTVLSAILPLEIHLYRFQAYNLILCLALISVIFYRVSETNLYFKGFLMLFGGAAVCTTAFNPPIEYRYNQQHQTVNRYEAELNLLTSIISHQDISRVSLEYFNDYQLFDFISPHFIAANLWQQKIESTNGLLIQSSKLPVFANLAAKYLGIDFYSSWLDTPKLIPDTNYALKLYRWLGVNYLILSNPWKIQELTQTFGFPAEKFGKYALIKISDPVPLIEELAVPLITFNNSNHLKSFYDFQLQMLTGPFPANELELIELTKAEQFNYQPQITIEANLGYAERQSKIEDFLQRLPISINDNYVYQVPDLNWAADGQSLTITGLNPNKLYRLNYTYLPFISSEKADLFRGQADRIILRPNSSQIVIRFNE